MEIVDSAIAYRKKGFSIIPMSPENKRPLVKWTEFQNRLPTETEIKSWWKKHQNSMIGIVTGRLSGISVIDADSPEAISRIEDSLPDSIEIPCVRTPRGGKHFYFSFTEGIPTKAGVLPQLDTRSEGGCIVCPPSINFRGDRYSWFDLGLERENLREIPEALIETLSQTKATCDPKGAHIITNILTGGGGLSGFVSGQLDKLPDTAPLFSVGRRDNDLFHLANSLVKSGMPEGEIFKYLDFTVRSWGERDETWIKSKIQSALKRKTEQERNIWQEIRGWVLSSKGQFLSSDVQLCLVLSGRNERKNLSACLRQLVEEGIIERVGNRNGCFRRIERDFEVIDLSKTDVDPLPLRFPFEIENDVQTLPKSLGVVAGTTNSGKSAFSFNFARLNMQNFKIRYLSSEMGAMELKNRILKFDLPVEEWENVEFIERSENFPDLILPDAITIIDYLEISDNFYQIGEKMKQIFDRLKTGFALICLQKKAGTEFGRGDAFSAEKPRLYITMEAGTLRIAKAKNWVNPERNPNGAEIDFKLVNGCKFIPISGWRDGHQFVSKKRAN